MKLKRPKLHDMVLEELLAMIRRGDLAAGERLPPEPALSEQFGISRGTFRAATQELSKLGYVEVRQGDGSYLRNPDKDILAQPFRALLAGEPHLASESLQFRRSLEPEVAKRAASCQPQNAKHLREMPTEQRCRVKAGSSLAALLWLSFPAYPGDCQKLLGEIRVKLCWALPRLEPR
jgi:GntR family transcriptional repressor for pyruvate dehydrogenase complex